MNISKSSFDITKNNRLRYQIAEIVYNAQDGHIPSAYSIVEILSVLFGSFLRYDANNPKWNERDFFILSKGHGSVALYLMLEKYGFITKKDLDKKGTLQGILGGHPDRTRIPGIEASTGSLGHGFPMSVGLALGLRIQKRNNRVITIIGDGESNEGTIWESALLAAHHMLGNLLVIVDKNKSTDALLSIPEMAKKWDAFGWEAYEVDGHNQEEFAQLLNQLKFNDMRKPKVIVAHTIKGKGVSFIENVGSWHSKVPSAEELDLIRKELRV